MVCPLCKVQLVASSEEECIAHMASCTGFYARHPANADGTSQSLGRDGAAAAGAASGFVNHVGFYVPGEDVVELHGLEGKPALNGKLAVVLGWFLSRGRWGVELLPGPGGGGATPPADRAQLKIKPQNLKWAGRITAGAGETVLLEEASQDCTAVSLYIPL